MVTFLIWFAGYLSVGFLTFRTWLLVRPRIYGEYSNDYGDYIIKKKGWHTLSWVDTSPVAVSITGGTVYDSKYEKVPRGQSVEGTFWVCQLAWPYIWCLCLVICTLRGLTSTGKFLSGVNTSAPSLEEPNEFMKIGNAEVNKICIEESE